MNESREMERVVPLASTARDPSFFHFSSPGRGFWSHDAGAPLDLPHGREVIDGVQRALRDRANVLAAGALPFAASGQPRLRLYTPAVGAPRTLALATELGVRTPRRSTSRPTPDGYRDAVARALAQIRDGGLRKVVLARALDLELDQPLDVRLLFARLLEQNPGKYVFRCELGRGAGERQVLLGASPELLVSKRGNALASHPLAGSLPRSADSVEDASRAARLLESGKNLREHAYVVEAVGDTLAPYCRELRVPRRPALVQTPTMWHLGSKVTGLLRDPHVSSLQLALALHPTPAVCGEPRARAAAAIAELEGFDRGFFAGSVGYCDREGDGEWALSIRCALVGERGVRLYAGAGVVAESTPDDELAETTAKLRTMLRALGLERLEDA